MANNKYKYQSCLRLIKSLLFFSLSFVLTGMNNPENYNRLLRNEQHNYYRQSDNYRERITDALIADCQAAMRARTWCASRVRETEIAAAKIDFVLNTEFRILVSNITSNNLVQESLRRYNPDRHVEGIGRHRRDNQVRNIIQVQLEGIRANIIQAFQNATEQRNLARLILNGQPNGRGNIGRSFNQILDDMRTARDNMIGRLPRPMPLLDNQDRDDIQSVISKLKYININSFQVSEYADIAITQLRRVQEYYDEAIRLRDEVNDLIEN